MTDEQQNRYLLFKYLVNEFTTAGANDPEEKAEELILNNSSNLFGYHGLAWQLGKLNMEFFCMYFLQDTFLPKENNAAAPIADVHKKIWHDIQEGVIGEGSDQIGRILPRGTGKSVFGTFAGTIWAHAYKHKKYTLICSDIGSTAEKFISDIKNTLLENEYIKKAFGVLLDDKDKRYKCNSTQLELTNKTFIEAISSASPMRGRKYDNCRPDLIILDDYQSEDDVRTEQARENKWKRYSDDVKYASQKAVIRNSKIIKRGTTFIALGTLQHKECFYSRLRNLPTWKFKCEKGVLLDDIDTYFTTGLWKQFKDTLFNFKNENRLEDAKEFYWEHQEEMKFPLLWSEFWDCLDMALSYYENPSSFKQEVQGDVDSIGEKRFTTIVTETKEKIETHNFLKTMLCVDPASSIGKKNDYSAFLVISKSENGIKYARKSIIDKLKFDDYIKKIISLLKLYEDITHVYIEKNLYMGTDIIRLKELIEKDSELSRRNFEFINEMQKKNKFDKIDSIVGDVTFGRVIFNEEDEKALEQLKDYQGEMSLHDDYPDCLSEGIIRLDDIEIIQNVVLMDRRLFGI